MADWGKIIEVGTELVTAGIDIVRAAVAKDERRVGVVLGTLETQVAMLRAESLAAEKFGPRTDGT